MQILRQYAAGEKPDFTAWRVIKECTVCAILLWDFQMMARNSCVFALYDNEALGRRRLGRGPIRARLAREVD